MPIRQSQWSVAAPYSPGHVVKVYIDLAVNVLVAGFLELPTSIFQRT